MPYPAPTPRPVVAPASAGVGLCLPRGWPARFAFADWPADWWQRNYDLPIVDPDAPDPIDLTPRMLALPPPSVTSP